MIDDVVKRMRVTFGQHHPATGEACRTQAMIVAAMGGRVKKDKSKKKKK